MSVEPSEDKAAIEGYVDALDHIRRVCKASRTQTRRLRWIEARARCAVEGGQDWRDLDIPASADSQSKRILNLLQDRSEFAEALQRMVDICQDCDGEGTQFFADGRTAHGGAFENHRPCPNCSEARKLLARITPK